MNVLIKTKQHIVAPDQFFKSCHASTLIALHDGSVVAAWFAGTHENHVDVGIWVAKMQNGIWSEPQCVVVDEQWPCWNPVLHLGENGIIYLFYKVGQSPSTWHTMVITSRSNAATWGKPRKLVEDDSFGRGPVKNKLIVATDKRWLAPASRETTGLWESFVDISEDCGKTWTASAFVPMDKQSFIGPGLIQPTLWESAPGMVHMLTRSTEGKIFRSDSQDGGLSWCTAFPIQVPNNNSGIDVVRMQDGVLALVYNPIDQNWGVRTPLSLSFSQDNGETWDSTQILEENLHPINRQDGEFSYPAIVASGNRLMICYTWRRKTIEYIELEVKP